MARHLDKDPATYCKERDGFIRDLQHFHETRGTPFRRIPTIAGHVVDLYLLYSLATKEGGWMKINSKNGWEDLLEKFDLPTKCVNGGVALKQVYIRYLDRYEKVHFLGEEAERGSDDDDESRHKRWSARALHSVPLNYNYHQHNIADSTRAYNGLSTTLYKASDYDRLALSLISPLPNEQDFAVNVCTLLCNEGKHTLRLDKCPRLVDYLLAHTGVFNHESLRKVFTEVYTKIRKHSLNTFWYDILESNELFFLANENQFGSEPTKSPTKAPISPPSKWRTKNNNNNSNNTNNNLKSPKRREEPPPPPPPPTPPISDEQSKSKAESLKTNNSDSDRIVISDNDDDDGDNDDSSDCELFASERPLMKGKGFKLKVQPEDKQLFCTGRTLGTQDYVGQRVLQIAHILRNLSFTDDNIQVLAANRTFLRFLLLCVNARWGAIHQLGLDMLGNIAAELTLKDQHERLTQCLIRFVTNGLHNQDRSIVIACLEILNKLSQREANEDLMLRALEKRAYNQVCSFLTLHDVMLLIYTLECLYALSSLGERACNYIVEVHGIIDTLVALVTVEGKSYGPKACIGMKLVETVPGNVTTATTTTTVQSSQGQQNAGAQSPQPVATATSSTAVAATTPARPAPLAQPRNLVAVQPRPITPVAMQQSSPIKQTNQQQQQQSTPLSAQHVLQQQHAHQQAIQENEQFALAWLRATYEPCGGKIEQQELYKQYLNSCGKIGRRGVIAPLHFPRCVRSVFGGTVGPNTIKTGDTTSTLLYYEGIRPRIVPLLITLPSAALQQTVQHSKQTAAVQRRKAAAQQLSAVVTGATATAATTTTTLLAAAAATPSTTIDTTQNADNQIPNSPASPILKAQLSAPPKPRESPTKSDVKSQVLAHPHLSQALLGSSSNTTTNNITNKDGSATVSTGSQGSSSLIKSLLATKVNECMLPTANSMRIPAAVDATAQVAQRQQQQRLLAQQNQMQPISPMPVTANKKATPKGQPAKGKGARVNGIRVSEAEQSIGSDNVSSTSHAENHHHQQQQQQQHQQHHHQPAPANFRGRREPPQPPPPPLAPLSTITNNRAKTPRMDNEDSDSIGNNSVASSTGGISSSNVAVSSTEDGDNSLTSFEGILLNGIPHSMDIDAQNEDSNSKDSVRNAKTKPLMLADLLEKKVEKEPPPTLNGVLCKELRIGDKGLELVDNHINKVINSSASAESKEVSVIVEPADTERTQHQNNSVNSGVKRAAEEDISTCVDSKKRATNSDNILSNNVNGVDSPKPESVDSNEDSNANVSVSATAANMYASLAADILEDEDEELLMQQEQVQQQQQPSVVVEEAVNIQPQMQVVQGTPMQQLIVTPTGQGDQQQLIVTPRQIIVSQGQLQSTGQQVVITAGGQLALQQTTTTQSLKPMLVQASQQSGQNATTTTTTIQQRGPQMVLSQSPSGQITHYVQHGNQMQQVQLVQAGGAGAQGGQLVIQAGAGVGPNAQYVIAAAQSQTALVQGQPQTVLVAQTPQQQGTTAKTIIILQQQQPNQKVMMTPQGQQVVVTQVQRPLLQSPTVSNNMNNINNMNNMNNIPTTINQIQTQNQHQNNSTAIKSSQAATVITQNTSSQILIAPKERQQPSSRPQTPIATATATATAAVDSTNKPSNPSTSSNTPVQVLPPPPVIKDINHPWVCEWRGCTSTKKFKSANEVYMHACEVHCPMSANTTDELQCLWDRCDTMRRKRFSLMTHLHDRHCSPEVMKAVAARRKQLSQQGKIELPAPTPPPVHPGYAPDAALHAIKRHALEFVNPKELQKSQVRPGITTVTIRPGPVPPEQDDNEGPVTKSIRLTASLILRNLVIYSNNSRRYLRHYEPHLAGVALSNVESSRTIAQLLYDLNDTSTTRR